MNPELLRLVLERLEVSRLDEEAREAVFAACHGEAALRDWLESGRLPRRDETDSSPQSTPVVFLRSLSVQGFRGIGIRTTVAVIEGPGLTVIIGRNGSGKSSLAEALEFVFTGTSLRWAGRSAAWKEGWRNLHFNGATEIRVELALEGVAGPVVIGRLWPPGEGLEQGEAWLDFPG